jgi:hypothetical protein
MDTFIWRSSPPFDRPEAAWRSGIPFSRADWLLVFPHGARHLVAVTKLDARIGSQRSSPVGTTPTAAAGQPTAGARLSLAPRRAPLSLSQLEGLRTRLVQLLVALDKQTAGHPVGTRVDMG